jgi:hypothetical protein
MVPLTTAEARRLFSLHTRVIRPQSRRRHILDDGPALGRPPADRISGSRLHNLKELRPGSSGASKVRILFIFDPARNAVLAGRR